MTTETTTPHGPLRPRDHRRIVRTYDGDTVTVQVVANGDIQLSIAPAVDNSAGATLSDDEAHRVVQALIAIAAESALDRAVAQALSDVARRFNPTPDPSDEPIDPDDPYWGPY
jgi:hypothetical protein